ncbi:MBOAT family O-acyltransferase, partial [Ferrovibrio sp.]|uniref:MBOAT family O-acyltransferase n=1 Tax=Ferrovibrio sp. TaxID=1917215 RepID=UPI00311E1ADA
MLFNDYRFLFLYLPLTLIGSLLVFRGRWREIFLIAASFAFYGFTGKLHAVVLAACILWLHLFSNARARPTRAQTVLAILGPAVVLLYFKYAAFLIGSAAAVLGLPAPARPAVSDASLPAGISFFTFHLIAYAIDRYRGTVDRPQPLARFTLFISMFPHLVAGPILRWRDVDGGLAALPRWRLTSPAATEAVTYILFGLALKVVLADNLDSIITPVTAQMAGMAVSDALFVIFGYSFQIYFDFYGYSLIAIGLGLLFGLRFPDNFARPYAALNPRDFWRRWHITLSYWIRDYLYLPLGGNRSYIRNILIVFALCGLWHGAGWNYVIWGLYHGVLVIAYHLLRTPWDRLPRLVQLGLTFVLVSAGWTLFQFDFGPWATFWSQAFAGPLAGDRIAPAGWLLLAAATAVTVVLRPEAIAAGACAT